MNLQDLRVNYLKMNGLKKETRASKRPGGKKVRLDSCDVPPSNRLDASCIRNGISEDIKSEC